MNANWMIEETVAAAIGAVELNRNPSFPDGEEKCRAIALEILARHPRELGRTGRRDATMAADWREQAKAAINAYEAARRNPASQR